MKLTIKTGSENYVASVVKIKEILPIEGADKIGRVIVNGNVVVTSKETDISKPLVYFTALSQLSDDLCRRGNLYTSSEMNQDNTKKGFIEKSRRVKAIKLRGVISNGLLLPLDLFPQGLKVGDEFTHIDGVEYVIKYKAPINQQADSLAKKDKKRNNKIKRFNRMIEGQFHFHESTSHLVKNLHKFTPETIVSITDKLHGCLPSNQIVKMFDGTSKEIRDIKIGDVVLGRDDESGKFVGAKVLNTFINGKTDVWIKFKKSIETLSRRNSHKENFICTPNHRIFVEGKGYIKAGEVEVGDIVISYEHDLQLTKNVENFLIGKFLGDGYVDVSNKNYSIVFGHKEEHEHYIDTILNKYPNLFTKNKRRRVSGYGTQMVDIRTKSGKFINNLFEEYIKHGKKFLPNDFTLNFEILANLYTDDGSLTHTEVQKDRASIAICSFSDEDVYILDRELSKLGFNNYTFYKTRNKKGGKEHNRLRFNASDAEILFENIKTFIPLTMQYKLPEKYRGFYDDTPVYLEEIYTPVKENIISKEYKTPVETGGRCKKYDIETETHNFISGGILVHNSSVIVNNILVKKELTTKDKIAKCLGVEVKDSYYDVIYSSRSVIKNSTINKEKGEGFYGEDVWGVVKKEVEHLLPKGVSLYGEIVGYTPSGSYIQKNYDYKCSQGEHKFMVYRVTQTNVDGQVTEFTPTQIKNFCDERGLRHSEYIKYFGQLSNFLPMKEDEDLELWRIRLYEYLCELYTEKDCVLSSNKVPEEGIVIRIEDGKNEYNAFKLKSQRFILGEVAEQDKGETNIEDEQ